MALDHSYNAGSITPVNSSGAGDAVGEGQVRVRYNANGEPRKEIYLRNFSAAAAVSGQAYVFQPRALPGSGMCAIDATAVATVNRSVVIAQSTIPINQYGWYAYWGVVNAAVSGSNVLQGDYLKLAPGTQAAFPIRDGGVATQSTSSVAVARANQTAAGAVTTEIFMLGDPAIVNV
jgi:hypothetical protein